MDAAAARGTSCWMEQPIIAAAAMRSSLSPLLHGLPRSQLPMPSLLLPGVEEQRRKLLILLPSGGATVDTAVAQWSSRWVERPVGAATRRPPGGSLVLLKLSLLPWGAFPWGEDKCQLSPLVFSSPGASLHHSFLLSRTAQRWRPV